MSTQHHLLAVRSTFDPLDGPLGAQVGTLLAWSWVIAFAYVGYCVLEGGPRLARARAHGNTVTYLKQDLGRSAAVAIGLVALPVIVGILIGGTAAAPTGHPIPTKGHPVGAITK
jgi:hypothetical protein